MTGPWHRRLLGVALALSLGARVVAAQDPRPAVIVQVAGATLYLNLGSDDGVNTGDTLAVRRARSGPIVGTLHVIGASARRSVLGFVGAAFPATRGDTLYVSVGSVAVAAPTVVADAATPPIRAPPPAARLRSDGAVAFELWGTHNETIGLGADPVRSTQDVAMPTLRFHTMVSGPHGVLRVNLRAQQRTGPEGLWDRQNRIRIYQARYDLTAGRAQITAGRFFSDFDHQSAFWDGASLRLGLTPGFSVGVAAGFEPERANEEVRFTRPKVAGFLGTRLTRANVDLATDVAVTQTIPRDSILRRTGADLALRLRIGRFSLSQDLETVLPAPGGDWQVARAILRSSFPVGQRGSVYATAISDRFIPLDTAILTPFSRRERVTAGYSGALRRGGFLDVNASVNDPSGALRGYAAGTTLSLPRILALGTVSLHASWFDDGYGTGWLASPAIERPFGATRLRAGYQYYRVDQRSYSTDTHGVDLRLWTPFGTRTSGVLQVSERFGPNLRSTAVFTSLEWRF